MAGDIANPQIGPADIRATLRARAAHVRALARSIAHDDAAQTLRDYADELEAQAATLEVRS